MTAQPASHFSFDGGATLCYQASMQIFVALLLVFIPRLAVCDENALKTWGSRWKEKYVGATPFVAQQKNIAPYWAIPSEDFERVDKGQPPKFSFTRALTYDGERVEPLEGISELIENRKDTLRNPAEMNRYKKIRTQLLRFVKGRPANRLVIILTGTNHAVDLFFSDSKLPILYTCPTFREETQTGNDDLWKLLIEFGAAEKTKRGMAINGRFQKVGMEKSLVPVLNPFAFWLVAGEKRLSARELLNPAIPSSGTVVIGETHGTNEIEFLENFPTVMESRSAGLFELEIVLEEGEFFVKEGGYTLAEARQYFKNMLDAREAYRVDPDWAQHSKAVEKLNPVACPRIAKLLAIGDAYQRAGSKVIVQGLITK